MSKQIVDNASNIQEVERILPPEVHFATSTTSFNGTAKPGLKINLSSSNDGQDTTVTVGKNGTWKMPLAGMPRPYTVFKVWASDEASGAESDKIQFTFGGKNPKLDDVYIGENAAFGFATPDSDIAIYASNGKQIGLAQAGFGQPFWRIRFAVANRPKAGDMICVIAKKPNGNTSMPHFTKVHTFSIEHIGFDCYSGSGAAPGEMIQLFDQDSGALIDSTKARDDGTWKITFADEPDSTQRIELRIIHNDGRVTDGLYSSLSGFYGVAPAIYGFNTQSAWGWALPYSYVACYVRDGSTQKWAGTMNADEYGHWQFDISGSAAPGNYLWVYTAGSMFNYAVCLPNSTYQQSPFPPLARSKIAQYYDLSYNPYTTWVPIGSAATIQSPNAPTYQIQSDTEGKVVPPDFGMLGFESGAVVFFGTSNSSVAGQQNVPTSIYTGLVTDDNPFVVPEKPTMTTYQPTLFAGTEATSQTTITIFDKTTDSQALNRQPIVVQNGLWTTANQTPDVELTPASIGDQVWARATSLATGNIGGTSDSDIYTVGSPVTDLHVPIPPSILNNRDNTIFGISATGTFVTVNMYPPDWQQGQQPSYVGTTGSVTTTNSELSWQMMVDPSKGPNGYGGPSGTTYEAYASFADTSNHSDSYFSKIGTDTMGKPELTCVRGTFCEGTSPVQGMTIMGWRSSDGKKIVNFQLQGSGLTFHADYMNGLQLPDTDLLSIVAAYGGPNGAMSPFDRKPYGWGTPANP